MMTGTIPAFETSRQKTNLWLKEVAGELHTSDRRKAYAAIRAVLHVLRNSLPVDEAVKFAAQMPLFIQGMYFEGWHPGRKPVRLTRQSFLAALGDATRHQPGLDPTLMARSVFQALNYHLTAGEIEAVRRVLPAEVRELWYELGHYPPGAEVQPEEPVVEEKERGDAAFEAYEPGSRGATPAWP